MSDITRTPDNSGPARLLPALIAKAEDRAALRFVEFFTVNIRNKNTRAAYARAAADFLHWCEGQGLSGVRACSAVARGRVHRTAASEALGSHS
jgi:hypothetical protein